MKHYKLIKTLSTLILVLGALMCALFMYLFFSSRAVLPSGVCPADNYRLLGYAGIAVLVISLVLSFVADAMKKRLTTQEDTKQGD